MRKFLILFLFLPLFTLAQNQTDTVRIYVTEDEKDCIQRIHDSPEAIKLLMSFIMSDADKMQQLRRELMNDPEVQRMIRDVQTQMRDGHGMQDDPQYQRQEGIDQRQDGMDQRHDGMDQRHDGMDHRQEGTETGQDRIQDFERDRPVTQPDSDTTIVR
jgi:hypothetical protein